MRKWAALFMALLMLAACCGAYANGMQVEGPRGPEGPSTLLPDENAGVGSGTAGPDGVTMGTDVYLYVNPDTASYVTFSVRNVENGHKLANAVVKVTYGGVAAVYGITDAKGECSVYLFRNVDYEYTVECDGYESVSGSFRPTEATCRVSVGMMKYHDLIILVKEYGVPRSGVMVRVNGEPHLTNDEGKVYLKVLTGTYHIQAYPPNGRGVVYRRVRLTDDTLVVINLEEAYGSGNGGEKPYSYDYLVFNKQYDPMDYVLTRYHHELIDIFKKAGETDADWRTRAERYLREYPNTIVVEAQPDRLQREKGADLDLTYEDQVTLLYTQNSLMPNGALLREWELDGFEYLIFANEYAAMRFTLDELHGENMTKALALMQMMAQGGNWSQVVQPHAQPSQLPQRELSLDASRIDWSLIRPFAFSFDQPDAQRELLSDDVFLNTTFEFRITPVVQKTLLNALRKAAGEPLLDETEIELQSETNRVQRIHQLYADGSITEAEADALLAYLTEGTQETLSAEELIKAGLDSKIYRVSCWMIYENVEMDITSLLPGMHVMWAADFNVLKEETERTMAAMDPSCRIERYPLKTIRALPEKDSEFYSVVSRKFYARTTVDVRLEEEEYRTYLTESSVRRASTYARETNANVDALVWVEK